MSFRSDDTEVCKPDYTGTTTYTIGELDIVFVYVVGEMRYAVDFRRKGTDEVTRLSDAEWTALAEQAPYLRSRATPSGPLKKGE